ncbi:hypothetical protein D8674_017094 [Pyrus ussuriensis x Pyrus communis]|uniref:DUF1664 domain-containing protein n=1 Tax=Pyrus ussuriensis x Pyrus communis TaxID=2448454 RepID=A0A5N5HQ49_9ROSA|nr:hypothetical protein D8674_017094 [Pyrus ussuriensis x Pyrus communis]
MKLLNLQVSLIRTPRNVAMREMEQGLTSLIVLGNGLFSDLIAQLQDILDCVNEADILLEKFDSAVNRAQIQQLDQEIRELTSSGPITIYNENSSSSGNYASYLVPVAALAAMGYCYMWWIGWSFSDVMYVTRHNMANVVEALIREVAKSKKLEMVDIVMRWRVHRQVYFWYRLLHHWWLIQYSKSGHIWIDLKLLLMDMVILSLLSTDWQT